MSINKERLRDQIRNQRSNKTKSFILEKSKKISKNLCNLKEFQQADHIFFYVSYNGEVDTHSLLKKTLSSKKTVFVPLSNPNDHTLSISELRAFSDLIPGTYGILEPKKEKIRPSSIHNIDVVLVPGVAFDKYGHRLGQGGGYYDWFLSKSTAISIALSFEFQLVKEIPVESHDQSVDIIVTEHQVIRCTSD